MTVSSCGEMFGSPECVDDMKFGKLCSDNISFLYLLKGQAYYCLAVSVDTSSVPPTVPSATTGTRGLVYQIFYYTVATFIYG